MLKLKTVSITFKLNTYFANGDLIDSVEYSDLSACDYDARQFEKTWIEGTLIDQIKCKGEKWVLSVWGENGWQIIDRCRAM